MCNAYSLTHGRSEIAALGRALALRLATTLDVAAIPADLEPRYRISPLQRAPILLRAGDGGVVGTMGKWGLLVSGGKAGFAPTNARDDKLESGWPWKMISRPQRCLVPADGFFEPEKKAGVKGTVPWSYYAMGNRQLFAMAGLWNRAGDPRSGEMVTSFTVVTTSANAAIRVHDRMPLILEDDDLAAWLAPGAVPTALLRSYPAERMTGWRVIDEARNSRIADHPGMLEPRPE